MTHLLVRVRDEREAAQAALAGIDAIEIRSSDPLDLPLAQSVRSEFPGRLRLRFEGSRLTDEKVRSATSARADEIALDYDPSAVVSAETGTDLPASLRSVAILAASPNSSDDLQKLRRHADSVMLDAGPHARLIDKTGIAALDAFASACRASDLAFGLAGGLESPDVARLLLLEPDVLAFDAAVRVGHDANAPLDPNALDAIRALVPRVNDRASRAKGTVAKVTDRIFVRDFEVSLAIGAYQAEHNDRQRVRFSVVADVVRDPVPPRDMRDVFSYDVIIETIRVLAERAHVTFVETLAEEVAHSILTHPEVVGINVKVEKLDVIAGAVGIEIVRRRSPA